MPRRTGYEAKRDAIIAAALQILAEHGYDALTIDEVLASAGISKGTFYHYFPSKQALVEAALLALSHRVVSDATAVPAPPDATADRLLEPALALVRPHPQAHDPATRALARVLLHTPSLEALRSRMFDILAECLTPLMTEVLELGARRGLFRIDDPTSTAELLVALTLSARARVLTFPGPEQAAPWVDAYVTIVERALGLPTATLPREPGHPCEGA